jgi:type IV fimbrial biogenesis protein FimT
LLEALAVVVRLQRIRRSRRRERRGFTLVEIIVVVIIIAVLAVLAIPTVIQQMRSRRTQFAAKEVAALYRNARMRAMGRGSAVLVRYDNTVDAVGRFEMREAVRSGQPNPNCDRLPLSSCSLSSWVAANPDNILIGQFTSAGRAELEGIKADVTGAPPANANAKTQMDVCFTPMGRTFVRYDQVSAFTPLTGVPRVRIYRTDPVTGNAWGIARLVLVMPNGNARLGTAEEAP